MSIINKKVIFYPFVQNRYNGNDSGIVLDKIIVKNTTMYLVEIQNTVFEVYPSHIKRVVSPENNNNEN